MSMHAALSSGPVEATVTVQAGEVLAVVGPNGAGKTTLLRAVAGLLPAGGPVRLADREVTHVPASRRGVGWVPQAPSLFAHLSVLDNAAYGLRCRGLRREAARRAAQPWLDALGVAGFADRRPAELSGGEAARVALARALAPDPDLLLLDEPLAALDRTTRDEVRRALRTSLADGRAPVLLVTHDPVDVVALADRLLVLEGGRVRQEGTPAEVARAPRSEWVAAFLGQNCWRGVTDPTGLVVGGVHLTAAEPLPAGQQALALCEPSAITLHLEAPAGSARNTLRGQVREVRNASGRTRVHLDADPPLVVEVTSAAAEELQLAPGLEVWAALKAIEVRLVPL